MSIPDPLVPAEVNLRDFSYVPVEGKRLLSSSTWVLGTGDERAAAMALWIESWYEIPAASLPDNDRMLSHLSQTGAKWKRVREHALRGWRLCTDGRWYHPVVAEKALEAWIEKLVNAISGATGNSTRWKVEIDTSIQINRLQDAVDRLRALSPNSKTLKKKAVIAILTRSPPDRPPMPPGSPPDRDANQIGSQGKGKGREVKGLGSLREPRARSPKPKSKSAETPLPDGFAVSERVRAWAAEKGHDRLEEHLEYFVGKAIAKNYTYVDWDQALMNAIRDDWAKLGRGSQPSGNGKSRQQLEADRRRKHNAELLGLDP